MKITILGCGSSGGVPLIGNVWGSCDPANPRNNRRRCSILVEAGAGADAGGKAGEEGGRTTLLVDTSPDMRNQLLEIGLQNLTAVLFTHAHADHCHGIDGLRSVNWLIGKAVPVYADAQTMADLEHRFAYIFEPRDPAKKFYKPSLEPHLLTPGQPLTIGAIRVLPIRQTHGEIPSLGFRFGDFAYSTDVNFLDDQAFDLLDGVKTWVVDCARERPHPTHANLETVLAWVERLKPERTWLTHMDQTMDYAQLCAKLPPHIAPAYDGLVLAC